MITKKRTTKLKMTEFDETFSEDYAEGTEVGFFAINLFFLILFLHHVVTINTAYIKYFISTVYKQLVSENFGCRNHCTGY